MKLSFSHTAALFHYYHDCVVERNRVIEEVAGNNMAGEAVGDVRVGMSTEEGTAGETPRAPQWWGQPL
jgi:hypothetical protein